MAHLALLLFAASLPTSHATSSSILPFAKSFDSLVAYYVFDDGAGFDLKESVSNVSIHAAGRCKQVNKYRYSTRDKSELRSLNNNVKMKTTFAKRKSTTARGDIESFN